MRKQESTAYYVYMLRCADGTLYTGWTTDPHKRIMMHNRGKGAKYTRSRLPVKMVYLIGFDSKSEAMRQEAAIKKYVKAKKEALIGSDSNLINIKRGEKNE